MTRRLAYLMLCGSIAGLGAACATKSFVQERLEATETKLTGQMAATETSLNKRADLNETKLRQTADQTEESRRALDAANERLKGLDARVGEVNTKVGEVSTLASSANTRADQTVVATHDAATRLSQRLADRNKYRLVETKSVYFDSDQTAIGTQHVSDLDSVAKALTGDPNAILELQGFADPRGSDRYNRDLARERVESVMRYLVQRHGVELRQLQALAMGKVTLGAGEKPSAQTLAVARRVDMRLLTPWSSWEDAQAPLDPVRTAPTSVVNPATQASEIGSALPAQALPLEPSEIVRGDRAGRSRVLELLRDDGPARSRLPEFLKDITPKDLGGED